MVAAGKTITESGVSKDVAVCPHCLGTGTVSHWNEIAFFEDRRTCTQCDAGRMVETSVADILRRFQFESRSRG